MGMIFAVGPFEVLPDKSTPNITYFCLPDNRTPYLDISVEQVHQMQVCFEEYLGLSCPHDHYKIVFLEAIEHKNLTVDLVAGFGAGIAFLPASLLHGIDNIDQTVETRRALALAFAYSWVLSSVSIKSWKDLWIITGLAGFLQEMYLRATLGHKCYLKRMHDLRQFVRQSDIDSIPLVCDKYVHPSELLYETGFSKAGLVYYMLERRSGQEHMQSFVQEMVSPKKHESHLKTNSFIKMFRKVVGSESHANTIKTFFDLWVFGAGCPSFRVGFTFNKETFLIDIALEQQCSLWCPPYEKLDDEPSLKIRVHEEVGVYDHAAPIPVRNKKKAIPIIHVACHSRKKSARRQRMEKNGEREIVDEGEPPINWLRVDPEMEWICDVDFVQPMRMWVEQLEKEEDAMAQVEAVQNMWHLQPDQVIPVLVRALEKETYFYAVRTEAAIALGKIPTDSSDCEGLNQLIRYFKKKYYSERTGQLKPNDFRNLVDYHVKKAMVTAIGLACDKKGISSDKAVQFLFELLDQNDNSENEYDDCYYLAAVIRAVGNLQPKDRRNAARMIQLLQSQLQKDALMPSYQRLVSAECLEAICDAMLNGFAALNAESIGFFKDQTKSNYYALRQASWQSLLRLCHRDSKLVDFIFDAALDSNPPDNALLTWLASATGNVQFIRDFYKADQKRDHKRLRKLQVVMTDHQSAPTTKLSAISLFCRILEVHPLVYSNLMDKRSSFQSKLAPKKTPALQVPKIVIKAPSAKPAAFSAPKKHPLPVSRPADTSPSSQPAPKRARILPPKAEIAKTVPLEITVPIHHETPAPVPTIDLNIRSGRKIVLKKMKNVWGVTENEYTPLVSLHRPPEWEPVPVVPKPTPLLVSPPPPKQEVSQVTVQSQSKMPPEHKIPILPKPAKPSPSVEVLAAASQIKPENVPSVSLSDKAPARDKAPPIVLTSKLSKQGKDDKQQKFKVFVKVGGKRIKCKLRSYAESKK